MKNFYQGCFPELNSLKVGIIGLGLSGISAANLAYKKGAQVFCFDSAPLDKLNHVSKLTSTKITVHAQGSKKEKLSGMDFIVLSPGVPPDSEYQNHIKDKYIISEIELASWYISGKIVGITGSKGKSTTTVLTAEVLKQTNLPVFSGGNLGEPLSEAIDAEPAKNGILVVELSSFQLEKCITFKPFISIIVNISEDHLDRYASMEEYINAKSRIFMNQTENDFVVVDGDSKIAFEMGCKSKSKLITYCSKGSKAEIKDDRVVFHDDEGDFVITTATFNNIVGKHNLRNLAAALTIGNIFKISYEKMVKGVKNFIPLPHRMELVRNVEGVSFYNDSKATNVSSAVASIAGVPGDKIIVIAGGKDKGGDYSPLIEPLKQRAKSLILIGSSTEIIYKALKSSLNEIEIVKMESLDKAVDYSVKIASRGDTVLLAPACSSYDQYKNYIQRGEHFKSLVNMIKI